MLIVISDETTKKLVATHLYCLKKRRSESFLLFPRILEFIKAG
jgi:hypothetical protein